MEIMIVIYIAIIFFSLVLRAAGKLRLTIPLLYIILLATVFNEWAAKNETLSIVIFGALMALVVASWVVTIVRTVRSWFDGGREEKDMEKILLYQLQKAHEQGVPADKMRVNSVGGVPIVEYDRD